MQEFLDALAEQRWDDHRYYHHSRINQALHLFSALSFVCAYVLLLTNPAAAAIVGWLLAMVSRQAGHFFFEPKDYDAVNQATHEYKEEIKVGYNLKRKVVLMAAWALSPLMLYVGARLGLTEAPRAPGELLERVGEIWLAVGVTGLLFRTVHLFFLRDIQTGLVWISKIVTDPFNDIKLYHKAPLHLLRGELIDPMGSRARA